MRRGLVDIVAGTRAVSPDLEISMTTNALGLARTAHALKAAGMDRVNVSLDSVRPETFHAVTRRDRLHDVVEGLAAAARPAWGRSRSTPSSCAVTTTTRRRSCCAGASSTATTCGSSSRCRSTPSTAGAARR